MLELELKHLYIELKLKYTIKNQFQKTSKPKSFSHSIRRKNEIKISLILIFHEKL